MVQPGLSPAYLLVGLASVEASLVLHASLDYSVNGALRDDGLVGMDRAWLEFGYAHGNVSSLKYYANNGFL